PMSRFRGPPRAHVDVHLAGAASPDLVAPEVDVFLPLHLLDPEATTDLHARGKDLPLLKGNSGVSERVDPSPRGFPTSDSRMHLPIAGAMVACPTCDAPMEGGFLGAQNWPSGIQWFR